MKTLLIIIGLLVICYVLQKLFRSGKNNGGDYSDGGGDFTDFSGDSGGGDGGGGDGGGGGD